MMRKVSALVFIIVLLIGGLSGIYNFYVPQFKYSVSAINVSGDITMSGTWSGAVYVDGTVTIKNGATITVSPGSTVQFNDSNYKLIVEDGCVFDARGNSNQPIIFKAQTGNWNSIEIQNNAYANFSWCEFWGTNNGITLINNNFRTFIEYCQFNDTVNYFFRLTDSKLDVISTWFESKSFENITNLTNNLNKINLADQSSELFIEYYLDITTENGYGSRLNDINVYIHSVLGINKSASNYFGKTDTTGKFTIGRMTAGRVFYTSSIKKMDLSYSSSVEVWDKWDGTPKEEFDISRQNKLMTNQSLFSKNMNLQLPIKFVFNYPPRIDSYYPFKIMVDEDKLKLEIFKFHDNDDFFTGVQKAPNKFDNITIEIKDKNGISIYDMGGPDSGKTRWIKWRSALVSGSEPELIFYRTIESPFTIPGPDDYRAKVLEQINITIQDPLGNKASTGPVNIEFQNVPDKPVINFGSTVTVTEDAVKYIPIDISDDDNETADIQIKTDCLYVSYSKINSTLKFLFPNEFGSDGAQILVNVTATDNCYALIDSQLVKNEVTQGCNVVFHQTPDPPKILGKIPNLIGTESDWVPTLDLREYWSDPDPDDSASTLKWYATGVNSNLFELSGNNVTAYTPLIFNLRPDIELGGAKNPKTVEDEVTIWLMDKYGLLDSQKITLKVSSTNLQPSLHKVEKEGKRITVDPENGYSDINYRFQIIYKDLDGEFGDPPEFVHLYLDDNPQPYMMKEINENDKFYKDGKKYYYDLKLTPGAHTHYFVCSDGVLETRIPDEPDVLSLPMVIGKIYIKEFFSNDLDITARVAFTNNEGLMNISFESIPIFNQSQYMGDIGAYFKITPQAMDNIYWLEITVYLGDNFTNYNSKWLRKNDMQLAYLTEGKWYAFDNSIVLLKNFQLKCNLTPEPSLGYDKLIEQLTKGPSRPIFTVIGWLDADGDGYFNEEDAFPFDPAARYDRDSDGYPGENEWVPGKGPEDSTSIPPLHEDKFPDDPAASIDDDNDNYPDKWNTGKSQKDSTSEPKLSLDMFPDNSEASLDTDLDGLPDGDLLNTKPWMDKDDDNDEMPDSWENKWNDYAAREGISYRFDTKNASDGKFDWDSDGRNNAKEYKDDTNPFVKDSEEESESYIDPIISFLLIGIVSVIIILIGLFMYTKIRREQLLEHKVRAEILEHINSNPGIHYRKLLNDLDLQTGVLTHHLNMLERQMFIRSLQDSMYRRFYPVSTPINNKLILSEVQQNILKTIRAQPGISQAEIGRQLNHAKKVVSYHVKILSDADFVRVESTGRTNQLYYLDGLDFGKRPPRLKGPGRAA